jgi:predicted PurR-regulated permease PerM
LHRRRVRRIQATLQAPLPAIAAKGALRIANCGAQEPEPNLTDYHSRRVARRMSDSMAAPANHMDFLKRTLIVVAAACIPVLIWYLFGVILMAFGAVILAMLLRLVAHPLMRRLSLPEPLALFLALTLLVVVVGGAGYLFDTRFAGQFPDVMARAGAASSTIEAKVRAAPIGNFLLSHISGASFSITDIVSKLLSMSTTFVEGALIMIISGIYLAAQPPLYRRGLIWMFPPSQHARVAEIFDEIGEALRLWLIGQLVEMILIGALSTLALWLIGVPSALALGIIAAIGEFIPYVGPLLAAIPAILVALTKSPEAALWTLLAFLLIHQIEGQLVSPLIQRHMVAIPPAVMLLGIAAITYLFGLVAIIFAAPIAVVVFAAVNLIYVRDTLGEKTTLTRKLG